MILVWFINTNTHTHRPVCRYELEVRVEKNKSVFSLCQVVFQAAALTLNSDFSELATKTCSSFDSSLGLEPWVFWCWCPGLLIRQPVIDRMMFIHSLSNAAFYFGRSSVALLVRSCIRRLLRANASCFFLSISTAEHFPII